MNDIAAEKVCCECGGGYLVTAWERAFHERAGVPGSERCPECRSQLRLLHTNELHLFKRTCSATGKAIVSNIPADSPYQVYSQAHWYSEQFDAAAQGRAYDFSKPFFEQFRELLLAVPRPSLFTDYLKDENCSYTNYAGKNKDCYLIFDSDENRDCYYSYGINSSVSSSDCYRGTKVELCYELIDSRSCYRCSYVYNCENCSNSAFLTNCTGCRKCFMCSNLKQKEGYIRNKPASEEEVLELLRSLGDRSALERCRAEFAVFQQQFPQKYLHGFQNEDVSGDYLLHCKNAFRCFDCRNLWDGMHCTQVFMPSKDCLDSDEVGQAELIYEGANLGYNAYNLRFCLQCLEQVSNLTYCNLCFTGTSDCFGCVGLRRKQYHILNRAYSKKDYLELVPRIVEHMKSTGEWGQFFPAALSVFPYNLTMAQEWYPLSRSQALSKGYSWRDQESREYAAPTAEAGAAISDVRDDVTKGVLKCSTCGKNYKITAAELALQRNLNLPLPQSCFHCRHTARLMQRNPRMLWERKCDSCGAALQTSYAPARPERVYCEACYLGALE